MNSRFTMWSTTVASIVKVDGGGGGGGGGAPTIHVCEAALASPGACSVTSGPSPQGFVRDALTDSTKPESAPTLLCVTSVQFEGSLRPGVSIHDASSASGLVLMPTLPPPRMGLRKWSSKLTDWIETEPAALLPLSAATRTKLKSSLPSGASALQT